VLPVQYKVMVQVQAGLEEDPKEWQLRPIVGRGIPADVPRDYVRSFRRVEKKPPNFPCATRTTCQIKDALPFPELRWHWRVSISIVATPNATPAIATETITVLLELEA
jgi:hypothetical protein